MKPTFSVIIPTYNSATFLRRSLNSVKNQTYPDFEVIIINNFSEDNTEEVVREIGDERVELINFRNNGVIGASRNVGVRKAQGRWIAFLDSDDFWYPEKLSVCLEGLQKENDAILIAHDLEIFKDGIKIGIESSGPYLPNMYEYLLFERNCIPCSSTVIFAEAVKKIGGFSERSDFVGSEDWDLWLRLSRIGKFLFINKALGGLTLSSTNYSKKIYEFMEHSINVLNYHFNKLPSKLLFSKELHRMLARFYLGAGRKYLIRGEYKEAENLILKAIKTDPGFIKPYLMLIMPLFHIKGRFLWKDY